MDDLTITKLCAEAILINRRSIGTYNPLHDDAQAMALVKKFDMVIEREKDKSFGVTLFAGTHKHGLPTYVVRNQPDLNRAICECVAKLQATKEGKHGNHLEDNDQPADNPR